MGILWSERDRDGQQHYSIINWYQQDQKEPRKYPITPSLIQGWIHAKNLVLSKCCSRNQDMQTRQHFSSLLLLLSNLTNLQIVASASCSYQTDTVCDLLLQGSMCCAFRDALLHAPCTINALSPREVPLAFLLYCTGKFPVDQ